MKCENVWANKMFYKLINFCKRFLFADVNMCNTESLAKLWVEKKKKKVNEIYLLI